MRFFLAFIIALSAAFAEEDLPNLGVIGGNVAAPGQFPYQVSIEITGRHQHCGGTIIGKNIVLTAAHCMYKRNSGDMTVLGGTVNRILGTLGGTRLGIKKVTIHEKYDPSNNAYDAAILELDGSFEYGPFLGAAKLPAEGEILYANAVAVVSGWGSEYHQGATTTSLKYVTIPLWGRDYCLLYVPFLPVSHLCAGDATGQRNSCPGDSGGPLVSGGKLIGIVSGGFGCGAFNQPALYTYVSFIRAWISQHTGI